MPDPSTVEAALRRGWAFSALCFLVVALGATLLRRERSAAQDGCASPAPGGPRRRAPGAAPGGRPSRSARVLEELEAAGIAVGRVRGRARVRALRALEPPRRLDAAHALPRRGRATLAGLERTFGELRVEQLAKDFRCVRVDLLRRSRFVHRTGPVADAVAASRRLPGLYPPYLLDGRLHVDGGVPTTCPSRP